MSLEIVEGGKTYTLTLIESRSTEQRKWYETDVEYDDGTQWHIRVSKNQNESKNIYKWLNIGWQTIERMNSTPDDIRYTYILYTEKIENSKIIEPYYLEKEIIYTNEPLTPEEISNIEALTNKKMEAV